MTPLWIRAGSTGMAAVWRWLRVLVLVFGGNAAFAACSVYPRAVVFNEVQIPSSGTTYLELRVLDPPVVPATGNLAGWKVTAYRSGGGSATVDLGAALINPGINSCGQGSPWIQLPDSAFGGIINAARTAGENLNFVLYEPSGSKRIVDLFRLGNASSFYDAGSSYESCPTIESALPSASYDRSWGSGGAKNWYRDPDGTGTWTGVQTANNANSICGSNNAGAPDLIGLTKSASTATVNRNTNFTFTLFAQNPATGISRSNVVVTDTLPAGLSFVACAATAPDTCVASAGGATWTISALAPNTTRSAVLTVTATTTGFKTNTISSTVAGSSGTASVTVSDSAPTITTVAATGLSTSGATLNGTVNPQGADTTVSFGYSEFTGSYVNTCTPASNLYSGNTAKNFSCPLLSLACGKTYYFRATGTNAGGIINGGELNFTTAACPPTTAALDTVEGGGSPLTRIFTKLAGQPFSLDILALNASNGVDASYNKTITPVLVDASGSGACATLPALQSYPAYTFAGGDSGRKSYTFTYAGAAPNVRVRVSDNSTPPITACSTDRFAIRPTGFAISSTDATADSSGSSAAASPKLVAGSAFNLVADSATAGYTGTPVLDSSAAAAHSGGIQNGALTGVFGAANPVTGRASGAAFTYGEVGYFMVNANGVSDATFTSVDGLVGDCIAGSASNLAVGGKFGCNIGSASSSYFGRFIPASFAQTSGAVTAACPAGGVTYMGQGFELATVLEARNAAGAKTRNYHGSYAKGTVGYAAENADDGGDLSSRVTVSPVGSWSEGVFTLAGTNSVFSRPALPDGPFDTLRFGVKVADVDGPLVATPDMNPTAVGSASPTYKLIGSASTRMRFGRGRLTNAFGAANLPLPIPAATEYWTGNYWAVNAADSCSSVTMAAPVQSSGSGAVSWAAGPGSVSASGQFGFILQSNGPAAVDLALPVPAWLQFPWGGGATMQNPAAKVSFGLYPGSARFIYRREVR